MRDHDTLRPLAPGTRIHEFVIESTIGSGSFGIVYKATHQILEETVAIKEFLPRELARRVDGDRVEALEGKSEAYTWARESFLREARTLKSLIEPQPHPNLVQVTHAFSENDTVYMCMRHEDGTPLHKFLPASGTLSEHQLKEILYPLLDGLEHAHARKIWHRDIKPSNILIRADGSPVLIDFGAARQEIGKQDLSVMAQCTPGYAAPEQMWSGDAQGPWTDIYALGATLYCAITGRPPQGFGRTTLSQEFHGQYSRCFLAAIDRALEPKPGDRPQTVREWRAQFEAMDPQEDSSDSVTVVSPLAVPREPSRPLRPGEAEVSSQIEASSRMAERARVDAPRARRFWIWGILGISLLTIAGIAFWKWVAQPPRVDGIEGSTTVLPDGAVSTTDISRDAQPGADASLSPNIAITTPVEVSGPSRDSGVSVSQALEPAGDQRAGGTDADAIDELEPLIGSPSGLSATVIAETSAAAERLTSTLECARVGAKLSSDGVLTLTGHVGRSEDLPKLRVRLLNLEHVRGVDHSQVTVLGWPFCEVISSLKNATEGSDSSLTAPTIGFNKADPIYREGEYLVISIVNGNAQDGYLYIDYIDSAAEVVHMLPTPSDKNNWVGRLGRVVLGSEDEAVCQEEQCYEVSPPHGRSLVMAIWSQEPLYSEPRPDVVESAIEYASDLTRLIQSSRAGESSKVAFAYQFIETRK